MRLNGKKALVTGAGSNGMGRAIALAYAREGADIAIHFHSKPKVAEELKGEVEALGRRASILHADLMTAAACRQLVHDAEGALDGLDIVVTAAAVIRRKPILELTDDEWDAMSALNFRGTFACASEAAKVMRAAGTKGRVIMIGSVVQQMAIPGQVAYGATKGGVAQLARGMALELARDGITVNVIGPGAILTDFNRDVLGDPRIRAEREAQIPMGRVGEPADVTEAAVYLASDGAAYTTGTTLFVDGGMLLT